MLLCPKLLIVARAKGVCACHANINLLSQFAAVLDGVLSKISRYDEGTFFSSILSFTVSVVSHVYHTPFPGSYFALNAK